MARVKRIKGGEPGKPLSFQADVTTSERVIFLLETGFICVYFQISNPAHSLGPQNEATPCLVFHRRGR